MSESVWQAGVMVFGAAVADPDFRLRFETIRAGF